MSLSDEVTKINTIFIDTAPIIYYIEAHPQFGRQFNFINIREATLSDIASSSELGVREIIDVTAKVEAGTPSVERNLPQ